MDLVYLTGIVLFFFLLVGLTASCGRLGGKQ